MGWLTLASRRRIIHSGWEGYPLGNKPGRLPLCQNKAGDAGMITRLKPMVRRLAGLSAFLLVVSGIGLSQGPAKDPGVRGGPPSAGTSFGGLSTGLTQLFQAGAAKFAKTDTVAGDGLGPRMNLNSCAGCHAQPTMGGSSAKINPQFAFVTVPIMVPTDCPLSLRKMGRRGRLDSRNSIKRPRMVVCMICSQLRA